MLTGRNVEYIYVRAQTNMRTNLCSYLREAHFEKKNWPAPPRVSAE